MISHQHRCIFIHVPRTGGTSIEDVIWPGPRTESDLWGGGITPLRNKYQTGGLQHLLARNVAVAVGADVFGRYFKFAIVRNPWDKAVSQFLYMSRRPELRDFIGMDRDAPLAEYLRLIERREHVQWMAQWKFLVSEKGRRAVDFIGRFENLQGDAMKIFAAIGVSCDTLPKRNAAADREDYRTYYDETTRAAVERMCATDLKLFGYRF